MNLLTKTNIKIIELITDEPTYIRDVAEKLNISPGKVHQAVNLFREKKIILEKKQKNRIIIALNKNNILVQKIKAFLNYTKLVNANSYSSLNKLGEVGLYGSYNRGTDDKDSDVDLFILTDKKELEIQPIIRKLEKEIQRKVNFITLTKNKIKNIKEKDPEFYIRLKLTSTGGEIFEY